MATNERDNECVICYEPTGITRCACKFKACDTCFARLDFCAICREKLAKKCFTCGLNDLPKRGLCWSCTYNDSCYSCCRTLVHCPACDEVLAIPRARTVPVAGRVSSNSRYSPYVRHSRNRSTRVVTIDLSEDDADVVFNILLGRSD